MADKDEVLQFHEMGLDDRILQAIAKLGWGQPMPIQEQAIPLALEGKDILVRAKTGSGKTAAFAIPLIQKVLLEKQTAVEQTVKAIILTPSTELCNQACQNIQKLSICCSTEVQCVDVSPKVPLPVQKPLLIEKPDIVIGTPTRILAHINVGNLSIADSMEMLVIDEADLLLSFGYESDMKALMKHFPRIYQSFLMSATMSDDIYTLKRMVLHNPVTLKLEESHVPEQLMQYHIMVEKEDKFALLCALLKLGLVRGRTLIFVNSVNQCYRLKMFLQQFGIKSCVLNSELPVSSRCHIVEEFNRAIYDIIIASDEQVFQDVPENKDSKKMKKKSQNEEYGVSRGIDFHNVANVINFEFPSSVNAYIHRIGRTARGNRKGTALSFVEIKDHKDFEDVKEFMLKSKQEESAFKPYKFRMQEIEGFRYRSNDALRMCTRNAIKEARLKEIRQELLNSEKLKTYFQDYRRDRQVLRHDKKLKTSYKQLKLDHVPDYIVPKGLKNAVPQNNSKRSFNSRESKNQKDTSEQSHHFSKKKFDHNLKRKSDPLKDFTFHSYSGKNKKVN